MGLGLLPPLIVAVLAAACSDDQAGLPELDASSPDGNAADVAAADRAPDQSSPQDGSPSTDATDASDAAPDVVDAVVDALRDFCGRYIATDCATKYKENPFGVDPVNCPIFWGAACEESVVRRRSGAIRDGRLLYDAAALDACLADMELGGRDAFDYSTCRAVFLGAVPEGGACYDNEDPSWLGVSECAPGRCSQETCPGVCEAFYVAEGEPCDFSTYCTPGSRCLGEPGVCTFLLDPGEPCDPTAYNVCAGALSYCVTDVGGGGASCQPQKEVGQPCVASTDCRSFRCDGGLCSAAGLGEPCFSQHGCAPGLACIGLISGQGTCDTPLSPGGPFCRYYWECQDGSYCDGEGFTCAPYPSLGSDCSMLTSFCQYGHVCGTDQLCRVAGGTGDSCGGDADCLWTHYCDIACQPHRPLGSPCTSSHQCGFSAYCNNGVCVAQGMKGDPCGTSEECGGSYCDPVTGCSSGCLDL